MEFSRQEYWSGVPLPRPGDLPDQGMELVSLEYEKDTLNMEGDTQLYRGFRELTRDRAHLPESSTGKVRGCSKPIIRGE